MDIKIEIKTIAGAKCGLATINGKTFYAKGYTHTGVFNHLLALSIINQNK